MDRPATVGEISSALKMKDLMDDSMTQGKNMIKINNNIKTQSTTIGSRAGRGN